MRPTAISSELRPPANLLQNEVVRKVQKSRSSQTGDRSKETRPEMERARNSLSLTSYDFLVNMNRAREQKGVIYLGVSLID